MIYTGIGSRALPRDVFDVIRPFALWMAQQGHTLRSGAADGADAAFEKGCDVGGGDKEIFLPWKNFNNNTSPLFVLSPEAFAIAKEFHPLWDKLDTKSQAFMARNVYQVLGYNLDTPSQLIFCWTPDGAENKTSRATGGTGQAIRIANAYKIPVYNIKNGYSIEELKRAVEIAGCLTYDEEK